MAYKSTVVEAGYSMPAEDAVRRFEIGQCRRRAWISLAGENGLQKRGKRAKRLATPVLIARACNLPHAHSSSWIVTVISTPLFLSLFSAVHVGGLESTSVCRTLRRITVFLLDTVPSPFSLSYCPFLAARAGIENSATLQHSPFDKNYNTVVVGAMSRVRIIATVHIGVKNAGTWHIAVCSVLDINL